jgi:hypothetical protein
VSGGLRAKTSLSRDAVEIQRGPAVFPAEGGDGPVSDTSRQRALKNYRKRLDEQGVTRFEVIGRKDDRALLRTLAKRLSEKGPDANRLRAEVSKSLAAPSGKKGGVLAALRRAPAGLADLTFDRPMTRERKFDL